MWYLNEERQLIQNLVREFAETEVRDSVAETEKGVYPRHLLKRLGELGIIGLCASEENGGVGQDWISYGIAIEEVSKEIPMLGLLLMNSGPVTSGMVIAAGTEDQIDSYARPTIAGDMNIAYSVTDPAGLYNFGEYQAKAVLEGDTWVLNGGKVFCTSAGNTENYLIMCATSEFDPSTYGGMSIFMVNENDPGFEVGHIENKLGWHGSDTGQIYMRNCRIPKDRLVGPLDNAVGILFQFTPIIHSLFGAFALGGCIGVWEKTRKYVSERTHYGESIFDQYQVVRHRLAKMWAEIECYRGAVYQGLAMINEGIPANLHGTALKPVGAALFESVASQCVELCGGNGVVVENNIERYYRDAKVLAIGGSVSDVLIDSIAAGI